MFLLLYKISVHGEARQFYSSVVGSLADSEKVFVVAGEFSREDTSYDKRRKKIFFNFTICFSGAVITLVCLGLFFFKPHF